MNELLKNEELKKDLLRLLFRLAMVDGELSPKEISYLRQLCAALSISEEMYNDALSTYDDDAFTVPKSEIDRMSIIYYTLFLMKADKSIKEEEEKVILSLGFKLGLPEQLLQDFINVVKEHKDGRIPSENLVEQIKKYLN